MLKKSKTKTPVKKKPVESVRQSKPKTPARKKPVESVRRSKPKPPALEKPVESVRRSKPKTPAPKKPVESVKKSPPKFLVPKIPIKIARTSKPKTPSRKKPRELERYRARDARHFRRLIMDRREKILKELGLLTESTRNTVQEYSGDHSTYSLHMADQGTDAQEREKAFLLASREGRYLKYLDRAVAMLDEGSYGKCTECGQAIQKQRLELVPTARLCISCKLKEEQRRPR